MLLCFIVKSIMIAAKCRQNVTKRIVISIMPIIAKTSIWVNSIRCEVK